MSSPKQFTTALRGWAEIFMAHSMRAWTRYVKASGLSMPQFSVLMRLHYRGGCGISDISEHLGVTAAAASQLVDRLVQGGMLERVEDPQDRRAKQVTLSTKGRALIAAGVEARNQWTEQLTTQLTAEERAEAIHALTILTTAAEKIATT